MNRSIAGLLAVSLSLVLAACASTRGPVSSAPPAEVQGTAEGLPFSRAEMNQLLLLAEKGIAELIVLQQAALAGADVI